MEKLNFRSGQSLIELLVAITVGTIIILATITVLTLILRISQQDSSFQTAAFLGEKLADNLESAAERDWGEIAAVVEGGDYHLATSTESGDLEVRPGRLVDLIDGVAYSSFFNLSSVNRDANGNISASGTDDPSTKKADIFISWLFRADTATSTAVKYIVRRRNQAITQSDWSGGPTAPGDPVNTIFTNKFLQSEGIDFSSRPGTIKLQTQ